MVVQYSIVVAIINLTDDSVKRFEKTFEADLSFEDEGLLYNNHHVLLENANIMSLFNDEITEYCEEHEIQRESIDIDEFEVASLTDRVDVYFEDNGEQTVSLSPSIKAYVHPKNDALKVPALYGSAYDSTTIIWSWPDDINYAHYLVEQPLDITEDQPRIIATIPMGAKTYAETGLTPGTTYTRRLVNFTAEQTSVPSESVTVTTMQAAPVINSSDYNEVRNYDFTSDDSDRQQDDERLTAFHSGIGHGNDLKVYKQMDTDFTQQFRAYYKVSGIRTQRERKYEQVGFHYKACLEGIEDIEEQEGEVTFDVRAYPREWVRLKDYSWTTRPVQVKAKLQCDVFLRKEVPYTRTEEIETFEPTFSQEEVTHQPMLPDIPGQPDIRIVRDGEWRYPDTYVSGDIYVLFTLDVTGSLRQVTVGRCVDNALDFDNEKLAATFTDSTLWNKWENGVPGTSTNSAGETAISSDEDGTVNIPASGYIGFRPIHEYFFGSRGNNVTIGDTNGHYNKHTDTGPSVGAITYIRDQIFGLVRDMVDKVVAINAYTGVAERYERDDNGHLVKIEEKPLPQSNSKLYVGAIAFGSYAYQLTPSWVDITPTEKQVKNGQNYKKLYDKFINKFIGNPDLTPEKQKTKKTWYSIACGYYQPRKDTSVDPNRITGSNTTDLITATTSWASGLEAAVKFMKNNAVSNEEGRKSHSISFFFTDGFPNAKLNGKASETSSVWSSMTSLVKYYQNRTLTNFSCEGNSYLEEEIADDVKAICTRTGDSKSYIDSFDDCVPVLCNLSSGKMHGVRNRSSISSSEHNFNGDQDFYIENASHGKGISSKFATKVAKYICSEGVEPIYFNDTGFFAEKMLKAFEKAVTIKKHEETYDLDDEIIKGWEAQEGGPDPDPEHAILDGYKISFKKYVKKENTETYQYDIDDYKVVRVEHEFAPFTFDETVTPVEYKKEENRAVIPTSNMLFQTNLSDQSLWEIIWSKVQQTDYYLNGYNKTIGTVEENGEPDEFLVRNLYIQDTYVLSDGSEYAPGFGNFEDGWEGSVNVYTDVDRASTSSYGDDCYLVRKASLAEGGNPIYIQGYTDAILFDHTRYFEKELNTYDSPEVCVIPNDSTDLQLLANRMSPNLNASQVSGNTPVSHYIKVIAKDYDVFVETRPGINPADHTIAMSGEVFFTPLTASIWATINKEYQSPVLNYRFNLEDHEAHTPICEIMPAAFEDKNSPYKHIVLMRVYYARNVYISNTENYVEQFGDTPIATTASVFINGPSDDTLTENLYKWTLRDWRDGTDNGWYLDNNIWFMSKKMIKTQNYYDELPSHNMEPFYGMVNSRYSSDNPTGKKDLRVQVPAFNIPTTVRDESIRIYLKITEFSPADAVVSYKWSMPLPGTDSVTHVNGDYVNFSSDSVKYKDVEYTDLLATIAMPTEEVKDGEPLESTYTIDKPDSPYTYHTYMLEGHTNNSDVLATRYPPYLEFNNNKATFNAIYKAVMNSTSKWSPRIHNGYYYINQHEHFAYSEFNVKANFETVDKTDYLNVDGYVSLDIKMKRLGNGAEDYNVRKTTRAELLIDEEHFVWEEGKGVTLAKIIDGDYYDEWYSYIYTSPVISFPNELTSAGQLKVGITFSDGSTGMAMKVRSYSVAEGKWSAWTNFTNNTVPNVPLGSAYQVRFDMQPSATTNEVFLEDYCCCYLDWKDDQSETMCYNISTITDHIATGPDDAEGAYVSRIIDLGCTSKIKLSIFGTDAGGEEGRCRLFIAAIDSDERYLYDENVSWTEITDTPNLETSGRFYRYKIWIPAGGRCFWLHKEITTTETIGVLPYVSSISMTGHYSPEDVTAEFIKTEAFSIPSDMQPHEVVDNVMRAVSAEVRSQGFDPSEISKVTVTCSGPVTIDYDPAMDEDNPGSALNGNVTATSIAEEYTLKTYNTPFIYSQTDLYGNECIVITGVPEQYAPITVEDVNGNPFVRLFDETDVVLSINQIRDGNFKFMTVIEEYTCKADTKYYELRRNDYEPITLTVHINGNEISNATYHTVNHLVIFDTPLVADDVIHVEYRVARSFIATIDWDRNTTTIYPYNGYGVNSEGRSKYKVFFETNKKNNKFVADTLSLNPVYRTDYRGFIYLTDDHNEPYTINIWADPLYLVAGGYDHEDISVEVLDIQGNPIINKEVRIDCDYGILTIDSNITDMNGVVHLVYESSYTAATDTIRARVLKDDGTELANSIHIVSM